MQVRQSQLRLIYSLLKPAVRAAARFHVPIRTLSELVRLAYFEHLHREGFTHAEIAARLGQTDRHMRSLAKRLKSDFFEAEEEVGLVREVENLVASRALLPEAVPRELPTAEPDEIQRAIDTLLAEQRLELAADGCLRAPSRYHVLSSDQFHHRIDALNHFLDAMFRALLHRLVFDEREGAMMKAISFTALPSSLRTFMTRFEGELRSSIAALEEEAQFAGRQEHRFTFGLMLAPFGEDASVSMPKPSS